MPHVARDAAALSSPPPFPSFKPYQVKSLVSARASSRRAGAAVTQVAHPIRLPSWRHGICLANVDLDHIIVTSA